MSPAKRIKVAAWSFTCERCGYQWVSLAADKPLRCSRCKSPYWDTPRRKPAARKK